MTVAGYTRDADFIASSAVALIALNELTQATAGWARRRIMQHMPELVDTLGFRTIQ